jgi:DNA-binding CsgD family transcriptional regulator
MIPQMGTTPGWPTSPTVGTAESMLWANVLHYSQSLVASLELAKVLDRHLLSVRPLISADAYGISALDGVSSRPVSVDTWAKSDAFLDAYRELGQRHDLMASDRFFHYVRTRRRPVHDGVLFPDGDWTGESAACAAALSEHGLAHTMLVPLVKRGALVGTLHFCRSPASGPFTSRELQVAGSIMGVAASAVSNALSHAVLDARRAAAEAIVRRSRSAVMVCDRSAQVLVESEACLRWRASQDRLDRRAFLTALREGIGQASVAGTKIQRLDETTELGTSRLPGDRELFVTHIRDTALVRPDFSGLVPPLTAREAEILECVADGLRDHEAAAMLDITVHTVRQHLKSIYGKLGARGRVDAVRIGLAASAGADA